MGKFRVVGSLLAVLALVWSGCSVDDDAADGGESGAPGDAGASADAGAGQGLGSDSGGAGGEETFGQAGSGGHATAETGGQGGADPSGSAGAQSDAGAGGAGDPVAGPATVTVLELDDEPIQGVSVVFYDPNKENPVVALTDHDGKASYDVLPGSFITVALSLFDTNWVYRDLTTFFETAPGDDLVVRNDSVDVPEQPLGSVTVNLPSYLGADFYYLYVACSAGPQYALVQGLTSNVTLYGSCLDGGGNYSLLVLAYSEEGTVLAFNSQIAIPFVNNGTVSLVGAWQAPASYELALTGTPATALNVGAGATWRVGPLKYWEKYETVLDTAPASFIMPAPPTGADSVLQTIEARFPDAVGWASISGRQSRETTSGAHAADLSALLPRLHHPVTTTDELGLPHVSWETDGSLASADGVVATAESTEPIGQGGPYELVHWTLIAPTHSEDELSPPALPAALADYVGSAEVNFGFTGLFALKSTALGSYSALRHAMGRSIPRHGYPAAPGDSFVTLRSYVIPNN